MSSHKLYNLPLPRPQGQRVGSDRLVISPFCWIVRKIGNEAGFKPFNTQFIQLQKTWLKELAPTKWDGSRIVFEL